MKKQQLECTYTSDIYPFLKDYSGFSLIELMVVIAIVSIITGFVTPTYSNILDNHRLNSTAHEIYSHLQLARHETLRTGIPIQISFNQDSDNWCYGFSNDQSADGCDCLEAQSCTVDNIEKSYLHSADNNISLAQAKFSGADDILVFSPENGTARSGSIWLRSEKNKMMAVVVSRLGRIRLCEANDSGCPSPPTEPAL